MKMGSVDTGIRRSGAILIHNSNVLDNNCTNKGEPLRAVKVNEELMDVSMLVDTVGMDTCKQHKEASIRNNKEEYVSKQPKGKCSCTDC